MSVQFALDVDGRFGALEPISERFEGVIKSQCSVVPCSVDDIDWMVRRHYLKKWPGVVVLRLGLSFRGAFVGAIIFALPPRETEQRYGAKVWELARLWVDDQMPRNTETWFIGQAVKYIRRNTDVEYLVSYADPSFGHAGTIYRAANWIEDGRTDEGRKTPRFDYVHPVTKKPYARRSHVPAHITPDRLARVSKHRFYYRVSGRG